jgi:hypothetical protein
MSFVAKRSKTRWTVNHDDKNSTNHSNNNGAYPIKSVIPSNNNNPQYVFH